MVECAAFFAFQLFAGGFSSIGTMNDGITVANTGVRSDDREGDLYLSALATTDTLTARLALGKGFSYDENAACAINGKQAYVLLQLRRARRV